MNGFLRTAPTLFVLFLAAQSFAFDRTVTMITENGNCSVHLTAHTSVTPNHIRGALSGIESSRGEIIVCSFEKTTLVPEKAFLVTCSDESVSVEITIHDVFYYNNFENCFQKKSFINRYLKGRVFENHRNEKRLIGTIDELIEPRISIPITCGST